MNSRLEKHEVALSGDFIQPAQAGFVPLTAAV